MRHTLTFFTLGCLTVTTTALSKADFEFPDTVPLEKRQTEGPAFECHNDCGLAIRGARDSDYCGNPEWRGYLNGCLDCALEYDIWRYYGRLEEIADACGIDATPRPAGGDGSINSAPPAESTTMVESTSPAAISTSKQELSSSSTSSATSSVTTSSPAVTRIETSPSTRTSSSAGSAVVSSASSGTPESTPPPVSEASNMMRSAIITVGVALLVALNLV